MSFSRYLRKALTMPPHEVVRKAAAIGKARLQARMVQLRDRQYTTYPGPDQVPQGPLLRYFEPLSVEELAPFAEALNGLSDHYLGHRFDLLGSGWVQVKHGMKTGDVGGNQYEAGPTVRADADGSWLEGRINQANLIEAQYVWQLVDPGYRPIDWQLDFKCGYRWSEATWFQDVRYAHQPGVDIKVPWEIGRMQHLPQLAWAYALAMAGTQGFQAPATYVREFRNQVLDFIATNPPRYGACWRCPMDVAIRAANWCVAYDLFRAYGADFDAEFEAELARSLYAHGRHIVTHLEYHPALRGNHYLSDLAGLTFIATYLPSCPETDAWLAFSVQELVSEVGLQFHADGSNFEASTVYHRLSAELVLYATALVLGLPDGKRAALKRYDHKRHPVAMPALKPAPIVHYPLAGGGESPFPAWYVERLERMADFTVAITRPDGLVPQFGDNDSGRFLKLLPVVRPIPARTAKARYGNLPETVVLAEPWWDEAVLDHRHLVGAINGLFGRADLTDFAGPFALEGKLIRQLAGVKLPSWTAGRTVAPPPATSPANGGSLLDGLTLTQFADFGLYVYRSPRLYLAVRCGHIGQNGNGGHAHNDALSIELAIDGVPVIVDPGTYLYTPLPDVRNGFRSTEMHPTLSLDNHEQNGLGDGTAWLFSMQGRANPRVVEVGKEKFIGEHGGFGPLHRRELRLTSDGLIGIDTCEAKGRRIVAFPLDPGIKVIADDESGLTIRAGRTHVRLEGDAGSWNVADTGYSPSYGVLQDNLTARLAGDAKRIAWRIQVLNAPRGGQG